MGVGQVTAITNSIQQTAVTPIISIITVTLILGALLGAIVQAIFVKHQRVFSGETGLDCFFGVVIGALWDTNLTIPASVPVLGGYAWPPLALAGQDLVSQALGVAFLVAMTLPYVKRAAFWAVPTLMAKVGVPAELLKNGDAPKP